MPIGKRHHEQKGKNIALLLLLLGIMALFFALTLVRFGPS